ncbi:hypothetical protein SAR116_2543 [Candidatus Puniceispirillum marinum IMCC1322]|uniref:Uncharacterized protein n=1 Tax=Puniceispirillum marinum (strain IMCC1322) TaxID=488538 RepID=D5BR50_PUNMI|nr:hypothetical protein SAR116_2543 [Candidatus Puniceispirillum marinum IMCC1322]
MKYYDSSWKWGRLSGCPPFFGQNPEKGVDPHAALEDNRPVLVMHRTSQRSRLTWANVGP